MFPLSSIPCALIALYVYAAILARYRPLRTRHRARSGMWLSTHFGSSSRPVDWSKLDACLT